MTVTGHSVTTSNSVKVAPESMVFTCGMDGNATEHKYPQVGQPAYGDNSPVTSTTASSFTINVGATVLMLNGHHQMLRMIQLQVH